MAAEKDNDKRTNAQSSGLESRFAIGDTVKHSAYVIQRARDYWLSCGREPMKSGAKADLDKKTQARGIIESVRTNPDAVFVRWNDGHTSDCLSYMVAKAEVQA